MPLLSLHLPQKRSNRRHEVGTLLLKEMDSINYLLINHLTHLNHQMLWQIFCKFQLITHISLMLIIQALSYSPIQWKIHIILFVNTLKYIKFFFQLSHFRVHWCYHTGQRTNCEGVWNNTNNHHAYTEHSLCKCSPTKISIPNCSDCRYDEIKRSQIQLPIWLILKPIINNPIWLAIFKISYQNPQTRSNMTKNEKN